MARRMSTQEFKNSLGECVNSVRFGNEPIILQQRGKDAVAVVPLWVLENQERARRRVFEIMEQVANAHDLSPEEAEQLALEEVAAYRAEKRAAREAELKRDAS